MNQGHTIFQQLIFFLPGREFRSCIARYQGKSCLHNLSCWDQYLTMAFAQLTYRERLRDIEICLRALGAKRYHLGFRGKVARFTLADANESRRATGTSAPTLLRLYSELDGRLRSKQHR
jgi:hypothetical protein